jgi:hypothetical protein
VDDLLACEKMAEFNASIDDLEAMITLNKANAKTKVAFEMKYE